MAIDLQENTNIQLYCE